MRLYLLAAVDAILAKDRRAARGHPHTGQRVAVDLVFLDHALALLVLEHRQRGNWPSVSGGWLESAAGPPSPLTHHVDSSVLPVVDLVVPYDGAAVGSDLDACQRVAVNVVALYQAPAVAEDVHAALVAVEDGVAAAK